MRTKNDPSAVSADKVPTRAQPLLNFLKCWSLTLFGSIAGSLLLAQTVAAQTNYTIVYDTALHGSWVRYCWENSPIATDFAAAAPGRSGTNAIEVQFTTNNAWYAFGLANLKPGWDQQFLYLNEYRTIEFDIYFATDSTSPDNLTFILEDAAFSDEPTLSSLIPGWDSLSDAQRYGRWFHVVVDLQELHPTIPRFFTFLLFNDGDYTPHFFMTNVRLGWVDDTTPPVVTLNSVSLSPAYDQLTLNFTTDEPTLSHVDYGVGGYTATVSGGADDWSTNHSLTLPQLQLGATVQYRVVASDHRTDSNAQPNTGYYTGTFAVPPAPTTPPVLSGFAATNLLGNRATLVWTTDRPCSAQLAYHKNGGADLTRAYGDLAANRAVPIDLLESATAYSVTVSVTDAFNLSATQSIAFTSGTSSVPSVIIAVNTNDTHEISPWIYGMNFYDDLTDPPRNLTVNRQGGNRWTAYNWENNASNAGSDWYYSSDDYLGGGDLPAEAARKHIATDRANGNASLISVQLQGYVAADKNGNVNLSDPNHLAARFKQVVFKKAAAFTSTPSTSDAFVYMDEFLWTLRGKFTNDIYADTNLPTFISLDNEPELWPSTHQEIQGTAAPSVTNYIARTQSLCRAIKDLSPGAKTLGPVHYGFNGIVNWQNADGFSFNYWFTDKYLAEMKAASTNDGRRLLDIYDIHWYSEATANGTRIGNLTGTNLTSQQIQAIVQSPRSLWDTNYTEASWVAQYLGGPVYILKRLQAKIDAIWPGTGLGITEYGNGGDNHIAGAIAQADNLGVFGSLDVRLACYWPMTTRFPFVKAGFKMFRDYDGNLGSFGDISIAAQSSSVSNVSAYVSQDSHNPNRHVVVAINRSETAQDVGFSGIDLAGLARVYRVQDRLTTPVFVGSVPVNLKSWVITLPPLSVSTIEISGQANYAAWMANHFSSQDQQDPQVSGPTADPDHVGAPNILRYAFNLPARGPVGPTLTPTLATSGNERFPAIQFTRQASATDIAYLVETSADLVHWSLVTALSAGSPTQITVPDTLSLESQQTHFLRVRVQYTP